MQTTLAELQYANTELRVMLASLKVESDNQEHYKNEAYRERNTLVALLASLYPSGIKKTAIEGWSEDWHSCVYIDFPWGQAQAGLGGNAVERVLLYSRGPKKGTAKGVVRVSACDADLLSTEWYGNGVGYWKRQDHLEAPNGYLHRLIALRIWHKIPYGYEVDHIDRNPTNNTRENLRLVTSKANKLNRAITQGHVRFRKGKWEALFGTPQVRIGRFNEEVEAREACASWIEARRGSEVFAREAMYPPQQMSWHYHDSDAGMFAHLPPYKGDWDGHTTPEKYQKIVDNLVPVLECRQVAERTLAAMRGN